jgi:hypothetical protein
VAPGDVIVEWNQCLSDADHRDQGARPALRQNAGLHLRHRHLPNGGYLTRALENRPELYDGGVDWEGPH